MSAPSPLDPELGALLLRIARAAIEDAVGAPRTVVDPDASGTAHTGAVPASSDPAVPPPSADAAHRPGLVDPDAPGASFVTLTEDGRLRGCIGSLEARRPLRADVAGNAVAAATRDPRFLPVAPEEVARLRIEVSVLTPQRPLEAVSREEALARLRPGVDGVVLEDGYHRATFLPQVWEQLPDPDAFLGHLARKAGLSPSHWSPRTRLFIYEVGAAIEPDPAARAVP